MDHGSTVQQPQTSAEIHYFLTLVVSSPWAPGHKPLLGGSQPEHILQVTTPVQSSLQLAQLASWWNKPRGTLSCVPPVQVAR